MTTRRTHTIHDENVDAIVRAIRLLAFAAWFGVGAFIGAWAMFLTVVR